MSNMQAGYGYHGRRGKHCNKSAKKQAKGMNG